MTVRELVTQKYPSPLAFADMKDETLAVMGTTSRIWETVLSSLGIWDAEVLEGTAVFDLRPDGGAPQLQVVADDATYGVACRDGQRVRLIVLPQEAPDEGP